MQKGTISTNSNENKSGGHESFLRGNERLSRCERVILGKCQMRVRERGH